MGKRKANKSAAAAVDATANPSHHAAATTSTIPSTIPAISTSTTPATNPLTYLLADLSPFNMAQLQDAEARHHARQAQAGAKVGASVCLVPQPTCPPL